MNEKHLRLLVIGAEFLLDVSVLFHHSVCLLYLFNSS